MFPTGVEAIILQLLRYLCAVGPRVAQVSAIIQKRGRDGASTYKLAYATNWVCCRVTFFKVR